MGFNPVAAWLTGGGPEPASSDMPTINELIEQFQTSYDEARAANIERYDEIVGQYEQLYGRQMEGLEGYGERARAGIEERWEHAATTGQQEMVNRGLTGTTIAPTMQMGYERGRGAELARLDESINQAMLGADVGLTESMLGFMERREDPYPDMSALGDLAGAVGTVEAAQAGSGGPIRGFFEGLGNLFG